MIGGRIVIHLSADRDSDRHDVKDGYDLGREDRRRLEVLHSCPDGAEVIVDIGSRLLVTQDAANWLHQHDERLSITIQGRDPEAVIAFVRAARAGGDWRAVS